ncbi:MAG: hypothetical protein A3F78_04285 [Burkholderiales bacterium RIFCSPLOWO2_12_FULL_61_40]|nr:MAG: hypothetical protein A3F78_04285 [Burkholderiales bacterium RIFCSPLOWO2_12_FULL_61_40]
MKRLLIATAAAALASASAMATTPAGLWKTIDDNTGNVRSLIRITQVNGEYNGTIEKLFRTPDQDQNPKCDKCEGALKDKPITGMTILTGLRQDGSEFADGKILDPENGKVYSSKASLDDNGKKLEVRGFIGVSLFGRSQTWVRAD